MEIHDPLPRPKLANRSRVRQRYDQFVRLVELLKDRDMPVELAFQINSIVDKLNATATTDSSFRKTLRRSRSRIVKMLEKELNLVPKNYYRTLWLAIGMSAFGIPMGVIFGTAMDNMGLIGVGLPLGLAVGLAVGKSLDRKAAEEGRQLDIEIEL